MVQSLKIYIILLLITLCGCRYYGFYETYNPQRESLSFINARLCVYKRYDITDRNLVRVVDTCYWKYNKTGTNEIIIYKTRNDDSVRTIPSDLTKIEGLNFLYDICPKWYSLTDDDFMKYADYKFPIYQEPLSPPFKNLSHIPFDERYSINYHINRDTIILISASEIALIRRPMFSFFFRNRKFEGKQGNEFPYTFTKEDIAVREWGRNSYEYLNYCVNYERPIVYNADCIIGKLFSYIGDSCGKESLLFVNDSICMHILSTRENLFSSFVPQACDTCRYSIKHNIISIGFAKDMPYDFLTYSNGILFYSKVYKNISNGKYTHIVKPFIDDTYKWANKSDSVNQIMHAYLNVYVPLNMYNQ